MNFSVLMSVYSGESPEYLRQSLQSLADQTLRARELVLVEDGPLGNELLHTINGYRKTLNIRSVKLPQNVGLGIALNQGLLKCSCDLVARMDTDDIALPRRFEKQVDFMNSNPETAVSSAWVKEIDRDGRTFSTRRIPAGHEELLSFALKRSPISHPAAIFRKSAVMAVGGYPPLRKAQDYGLWANLLVNGYRADNLQEPLCLMRMDNKFDPGQSLKQLRNEWAMFRFQRQIGFIGWPLFARNVGIRCILRLSPAPVQRALYRHARPL